MTCRFQFMIALMVRSFTQGLNARLNLLKRTAGQPFAAGGGLVDAQPVRQELSFVNLSSPHHTALSG
jgi:hypothetical protein